TPGMGKTTILSSVSKKIKTKKPSQLVIRVNLNNFTKALDQEATNRSFNEKKKEKAIDFMVDSLMELEIGGFESRLVKWRLTQTGGVVVLFDGFDEISPDYEKVMTQLIRALKRTKVEQIWVTTRPHWREHLEKELRTFA